jgi:hypothetical protein
MPPSRTRMARASTSRKGSAVSSSRRGRQALLTGARSWTRGETVDFENAVPHNSSVMRRPFRGEPPWITLSMRVGPSALSGR